MKNLKLKMGATALLLLVSILTSWGYPFVPATQLQVNQGTLTTAFVSPATLAGGIGTWGTTNDGTQFSIMNYGADPLGIFDSQLAIQTAINFCQSNHGGVVYFPQGHWLVHAPFTNQMAYGRWKGNTAVNGVNAAQIHFQWESLNTNSTYSVTLTGPSWLGGVASALSWPAGVTINTNLAVIFSDRTDGNTANNWIFGCDVPASDDAGWGMNNIRLNVFNLHFQCPNGPTLGCLGLGHIGMADVEGCGFDVNTNFPNITDPTAGFGSSIALLMPKINNWGVSIVRNCDFVGYPIDLQISDHFDASEIRCWGSIIPVQVNTADQGMSIDRMEVTACSYVFSGNSLASPTILDVKQLQCEHTALTGSRTWQNSVSDVVNDTGNLLSLRIGVAITKSGIGFVTNGFVIPSGNGAHIQVRDQVNNSDNYVATSGTNTVTVTSTGITNLTPWNLTCDITGTGITVKDPNGNGILGGLSTWHSPLKPGWVLNGTGVAGIAIQQ